VQPETDKHLPLSVADPGTDGRGRERRVWGLGSRYRVQGAEPPLGSLGAKPPPQKLKPKNGLDASESIW